MRKMRLFSMTAVTHVHVGEGQTQAAIDQPIARERQTELPFIPGHGIKGANRSQFDEDEAKTLFGDIGQVSHIIQCEASLLLLPLRAKGLAYVQATSPLLLRRLARSLAFVGRETEAEQIFQFASEATKALSENGSMDVKRLMSHGINSIEGFEFESASASETLSDLAAALTEILDPDNEQDLAQRLIVMTEEAFKHFATHALPVRTRNALSSEKTSINIWQEETLAPDTVFACIIGARDYVMVELETGKEEDQDPVDLLLKQLGGVSLEDGGDIPESVFFQVGGNETVGQGFFKLRAARNCKPRRANEKVDGSSAGGAGA